jgi:hypothetical protein
MSLKPVTVLGALALLLPAPALSCPTELGAGIVYAMDDGSTTTVTPGDQPGHLRERVLLAEDDGYDVESLFGLFELDSANFDANGPQADTRETSVYAEVPMLPEPGTARSGITASVDTASERFTRRMDVQAGPLAEVTLGGCVYQGYSIEIRTEQPDETMVHRFLRVPALGMAFYVGFSDEGGTVTYQVTSLAPVAVAAPTK